MKSSAQHTLMIGRSSLVLAACALLLMTGCRPPEDEGSAVRLGYLNEFCKGDNDCRSPLVCEQSVCQFEETPGGISCIDICDRLVRECGRNENNCTESCRRTIDGWSAEAITIFGQCSLGMTTPELTCQEAIKRDAPTFCYQQIPLDEARRTRCDVFVEQAKDYASNPTEKELVGLRQECYIRARTRSEADWAATDMCDDSQVSLTPAEVITCFNSVFELNKDGRDPLAVAP